MVRFRSPVVFVLILLGGITAAYSERFEAGGDYLNGTPQVMYAGTDSVQISNILYEDIQQYIKSVKFWDKQAVISWIGYFPLETVPLYFLILPSKEYNDNVKPLFWMSYLLYCHFYSVQTLRLLNVSKGAKLTDMIFKKGFKKPSYKKYFCGLGLKMALPLMLSMSLYVPENNAGMLLFVGSIVSSIAGSAIQLSANADLKTMNHNYINNLTELEPAQKAYHKFGKGLDFKVNLVHLTF